MNENKLFKLDMGEFILKCIIIYKINKLKFLLYIFEVYVIFKVKFKIIKLLMNYFLDMVFF